MTLQVCSFGGGVQSTALLVMAAQKELDCTQFLFANVGDDSEHPATLRYVHDVAMPYAVAHGLEIVELRRMKRDGTPAPTLLTLEANVNSSTIHIPVRMSNGAPGNRRCTSDYKIAVVNKWLREHGATKKAPANLLLGISLDEFQRMRTSEEAYRVNVYPLIERRMSRQDCMNLIARAGLAVPPKSSCWFCFAGETEVITPEGAKPIRDLVGETSVLVPIEGCGTSRWQSVEVRSFGVQPLVKLTLRRTCSVKTLYVTAEHRWVTKDRLGCWLPFKTTQELQEGDVIPSSKLKPVLASHHPVTPSPFGVAHGFVFGDGHLEKGQSPASVILHGEKAQSLLPYFAHCGPREVTLPSGGTGTYLYNLPRQWKSAPPFTESRSYLLGWLAGYFAADGHVSLVGQATLCSAKRENLSLVRDIGYLLGIETSPICEKIRNGFNGDEPVYTVTLCTRDLPETFWLNQHHRERVMQRHTEHQEKRSDWKVVSVEPTECIEEVFCAVVPGREMFVLADNLVTGNCPYHRMRRWQEMADTEPELFAKSVQLERTINEKRARLGRDNVYLTDRHVPLDRAVGTMTQGNLFEAEPSCDSGFCFL